jgi:L-malate glycosyltransferase
MVNCCDKFKQLHIVIFANERSIHTRRWVLGLRGLGHQVDLITFYKDTDHDIGGIDLGVSSKAEYLLKVGKLREIVKKLQPDIFHAHYASSFGFLASFVKHPRKVLSVWGEDIIAFPQRSFINKKIVQKSLADAHQITATSEFLERVTRTFPIKLPPITVIPFGIDLNQFSFVERKPQAEIKIGIAKHLEAQYGIDTLIKAFQILTGTAGNIRLIIAGKGTRENEYKQLVKGLGLEGIIDFIGPLEHSKVPEFLRSVDIAAMPSRFDDESFGVAALEASATGLPVVATRVGGIPEVVVDGVTGFLAEKEDEMQIAKYLERLVKDPDLRIRMGLAGRKMVAERYRWEDNLQSMQNLYYGILK